MEELKLLIPQDLKYSVIRARDNLGGLLEKIEKIEKKEEIE